MKKNKENNFEIKIAKYSLAAGAVLASAAKVDASVQVTTVNQTVNAGSKYNIDFDNAPGTGDEDIAISVKGGGNTVQVTDLANGTASFIGKVNGGFFTVKALTSNEASIKATPQVSGWGKRGDGDATIAYPGAGFENKTDHYMGVKFQISGQTHYGWVKMTVGNLPVASITVTSYAYETTANTPIAKPLPVELTSFNALVTLNSVKLKWETATEVNNYGFEIERCEISDIRNEIWEKIGFVEGHGNSNSPKKYIFEDKTYAAGKVYKYRLKQIDFDGAFEHSDELVVETTVPEKAELAQNYPNPFNPSTTIKFSMPEADFAKLTVYNSIGQEVSVLINENLEPGFYTYLFDGSKLASGAYVYKLETAGRVITKKMLLIK